MGCAGRRQVDCADGRQVGCKRWAVQVGGRWAAQVRAVLQEAYAECTTEASVTYFQVTWQNF